jgi:hypothetical protein
MSLLERLILELKQAVADGQLTREGFERLRQTALHQIDHGTEPADDIREALRAALDTTNRPDARSWQIDSGHPPVG